MKIDFGSQTPIFLQLSQGLEDEILSGVYREGEQIPSITELAASYKINPATALKGINLLVDAGIVYKKRGIGMFVAEGAKAAIMKKRKEHFFDDYIKGLLSEAASLGISRKELIEMIADAGETEKKTSEKG